MLTLHFQLSVPDTIPRVRSGTSFWEQLTHIWTEIRFLTVAAVLLMIAAIPHLPLFPNDIFYLTGWPPTIVFYCPVACQ